MVKIDKTKCVGCSICANICPDGIKMEGNKARIKNEKAECLKEAATACPKGAILLNENTENQEGVSTNFNQNLSQSRGQERKMNAGTGRGFGIGPRNGRGRGRGGRGQGRGGRWLK